MCAPATVAVRHRYCTSKRSSCRKPPDVESAGTATSRRQHLPVRHEARPEEVRCLCPPLAVHYRPLPAGVRTVCPLTALLAADPLHRARLAAKWAST
eukprot:6182633-Prymnesium_polylepis.1